jgi:hypothetical protein
MTSYLLVLLGFSTLAFGQDLFMASTKSQESNPAAKCTVYQNKSTNCEQDCGRCFNPGSRPGYVFPGSSTGYYATSDVGDVWVGACIDWSLGSKSMLKAEAAFNSREKDSIYFGIGTYGTNDAQRGLGACFRLKVDTLDRDLLVQSVNTGSDVSGNQFDDLVALCEYAFDKKVRGEGGSNPTLLDASRVKCPPELVELTGIQRSDDPSSYVAVDAHRVEGFPNANKCQADQPGGGTAYCLTRMMDCRKPSGAFKDNIQSSLVVSGKKLVQPCLPDGYTRVDVQCGCQDCYC